MPVTRTSNQRLAGGDRCKDEGAVTDRLVPGESQLAAQVRGGGDTV
jgi:hypothetical protein